MTGELDRRPTRFSTAVVVAVTVLTTAVLTVSVGLTQRVLYGVAGGLLLAGVLWVFAHERWTAAGGALAAVVFPVVGLALLTGTGYTVAAQLRDALPIGSVFLVAGATIAVFGAIVAVRDVLEKETLLRCLGSGLRTTIVVTGATTAAALLQFAPLGRQISVGLQSTLSWLFTPAAGVPLASFLLLVLGSVYGLRGAVLALPIDELLGDSIDPDTRAWLADLDRWLSVVSIPLAIVTVLTVLVELALPAPYAWLPAGVRALVGGLTGIAPLRWLLGLIAAVSLTVAGTVWFVRTTYRSSNEDALAVIVPYLSGGVLAVAATLWHGPFLSALTGRIEHRLPAQLIGPFEQLVASMLDIFGGELLALIVLTSLLLVTLVVVVGLLVVVLLGILREDAGGASLAAAGLLTAAGFGAVLGVGLPVTLSAVVASLLVWDAGEFGVTLGNELGSRTSAIRTELAHGGGTVLVGVAAIGLGIGVDIVASDVEVGSTVATTALLGAIAGALLLVIASR